MTDWIKEAEKACVKFRELGDKPIQYWLRPDVRDFEKAKERMHTALPRALAIIRAADELERTMQEVRDTIHACNRSDRSTPARVRQEVRELCDDALAAYRKTRHET